jgi:hypothetical protein
MKKETAKELERLKVVPNINETKTTPTPKISPIELIQPIMNILEFNKTKIQALKKRASKIVLDDLINNK